MTDWIYNSPADDFWPVTAVLVAITVAGFLGAFYFFYRKRIMEDTPTSKIRSAAQGYVELHGIGELMEGPPIIAPLTRTTCTWYEYEIEEHRRSGKNSKWVSIDSGKSTELFLLVDDTGKCVVDPDGANVTTSTRDVWYGHNRRPSSGPPAGRNRFPRFVITGKYRYTEKRLHPGETLYAIGLFKTVGGAGGDLNIDTDVRDMLKEWKLNSETLIAKFDRNKDGEIDMEEWQNVRNEAFKEVMARRSEKESPPVNVMSGTLDRRRPYMLSSIAQEFLIRRYQYLALGLISLFFICGAAATWMISVRLGGN